jgi:hypothetical protein
MSPACPHATLRSLSPSVFRRGTQMSFLGVCETTPAFTIHGTPKGGQPGGRIRRLQEGIRLRWRPVPPPNPAVRLSKPNPAGGHPILFWGMQHHSLPRSADGRGLGAD